MSSRSVRMQVLLIVNLTLGSLLAILLVWDYRREMSDAVQDKQIGLQDEAIAVHQAVMHLLRGHGVDDVQQYVNTVCFAMRDSHSPGHHIVVEFDHQTVQAHRAESQELAETLRAGIQFPDSEEVAANRTDQCVGALRVGTQNPDHRVTFQGKQLVVAGQTGDGITVYISEYLTNIRRAIRQEVLWQSAILAALAVLAAGIVNVMLLKLVARPLQSLAAVVTQIAKGTFDTRVAQLGSAELDELAIAVNSMSNALAESEQHRRAQMEKARLIQEHLLPQDLAVPGLTASILFSPAEEVAGDYYDLFALSDGTWLICIADVVGHGVPAAMGAAMFKMLLASAAERHMAPGDILSYVNGRFLAASLSGYFVSVFLARWHPESMQLDYANAGHEPGLLSSGGRTISLSATGLFVGVGEGLEWTTETRHLAPCDRLLIMTDGVVETGDAQHNLFGRHRVAQMFTDSQDETIAQTVEHIQAALAVHQGKAKTGDDTTLLVIEFDPTVATTEEPLPQIARCVSSNNIRELPHVG